MHTYPSTFEMFEGHIINIKLFTETFTEFEKLMDGVYSFIMIHILIKY